LDWVIKGPYWHWKGLGGKFIGLTYSFNLLKEGLWFYFQG